MVSRKKKAVDWVEVLSRYPKFQTLRSLLIDLRRRYNMQILASELRVSHSELKAKCHELDVRDSRATDWDSIAISRGYKTPFDMLTDMRSKYAVVDISYMIHVGACSIVEKSKELGVVTRPRVRANHNPFKTNKPQVIKRTTKCTIDEGVLDPLPDDCYGSGYARAKAALNGSGNSSQGFRSVGLPPLEWFQQRAEERAATIQTETAT